MSEQNKINLAVIVATVSLVASMLTSILFTPFLLESVGDAEYGLKSLADSFVSFVSIFTGAMSHAFVRFHKKYGKEGEGKVIGAFLMMFLLIALGIIIFGAILLVLTFSGVLLPSDLYTEDQVHTFAIILAITILFTAASTILGLFHYYDESNKLLITARSIHLLVVVSYPAISIPLLLNGCGIIVITIVYCIVHLVSYIAYGFFAIRIRRRNLKENPNISKISRPSFSLIKEVLVFSIVTVLISASVTFNASVDKVIIGSTSGAESVTIYQLSSTLSGLLLSTTIIYTPYMPAATEAYISRDTKKVQSIFNRGGTLIAFVGFAVFLGFAFAGKEFICAWVGEEKVQVYANTVILFSAWPLYGVARMSDGLSKCADRQKMSLVIFASGLILHTIITLSLISFLGMWACFIGEAVSMLYISIAFLVFDVKVLGVGIKHLMINCLKFLITGGIAIGASFALDYFALAGHYPASNILTCLIKCLFFIGLWLPLLVAFFWKETKGIFIGLFIDQKFVEDDGTERIKLCMISKIKKRIKPGKKISN